MSRRGKAKDAIIAAAARLISTQGVHAASISRIISESGTSAGTIYHHFANKNQVVLAVAQKAVVEPLQEAIASHSGDGISPANLFLTIVDLINSGRLKSELIVNLWAASSNEPQLLEIMQTQMSGAREGVSEQIQRWLEAQGIPNAAARAEPLAMLCTGQAMGLLTQRVLFPGLDQESYVAEACRMLNAV